MMEGKLVIISAPSGAGKTTIVNHLLSKNLGLEFSISATTRKPRGKEKDGTEYYFISPEKFRQMIANSEFAEWEEVYSGQFYGTPKSEIERIWKRNKHVLFDVDVKGGINLKDMYRNKALAIFLMPPSTSDLLKRLRGRGTDEPEKIMMRVRKAHEEMLLADRFDHIVINDNLESAQKETYEIVRGFLKI